MRRIALPASAAISLMVVTPLAVSAEPMVLTPTQMESITAAGPSGININVSLSWQTIITTQAANAIAVAIANCGICVGGAPSALSLAGASNASVSAQQIGR
jgi:hypothetical protein